MEKPAKLQTIGILQLISGILNLTLVWWLWFMLLSVGASVCAAFTMGFGIVTYICAIVPWLLIPIGIFEVVTGVFVLAKPEASRTLLTIAAIAEIVSIVFGGVVSCVVGIVALVLVNDSEVKAYHGKS